MASLPNEGGRHLRAVGSVGPTTPVETGDGPVAGPASEPASGSPAGGSPDDAASRPRPVLAPQPALVVGQQQKTPGRVHRNRFRDHLNAVRVEALSGPPQTVVDFRKIYGLPGRFYGGEVILFLGDTGLGKSSFWQNVGFLIGQEGFYPGEHPVNVLDCSMEMTKRQHARRYLQIAHGLSVIDDENVDQVQYALTHPEDWSDEKLYAPLSHLAFESVEAAPLKVSDVEERAREHGAGLVILDTLEAFGPDVPDGTRLSSYDEFELICRQIKAMAARLNALVVVVHHLNKEGQRAAGRGGAVQITDAKGPTIAAQLFDFTMTFVGSRRTNRRHIALQKWRRTQSVDIHLLGDPATLRFGSPPNDP